MTTRARAVAFYLPQFHPIPENDGWWGAGFTEWTNVVQSDPLFEGHYQPHLPANLGYYDLRVREVRARQADLARQFGIEAFCYWHYWFEGRRLLERPFGEVLASGEPDFPFCLAWANESWSRRWLGEELDVLQPQTYSPEDHERHARWLAHAFASERYLTVDGRPVFLVYRPFDLPDPHRATDTIRAVCVAEGLQEPLLLGVNAHSPHLDSRSAGFDETVDFEPQLGALPGIAGPGLKIYDDEESRSLMAAMAKPEARFRTVFVSWDNTPRRGSDGIVVVNSSPSAFGRAFARAVDAVADRPHEQRLVFVNAWNEWAEGNHLEPDQRHGVGYLEAVRRVISGGHDRLLASDLGPVRQ